MQHMTKATSQIDGGKMDCAVLLLRQPSEKKKKVGPILTQDKCQVNKRFTFKNETIFIDKGSLCRFWRILQINQRQLNRKMSKRLEQIFHKRHKLRV